MNLNTEEFFDAVAPIAIYHLADLRFQQKAKIGLRKLKAAGKLDPAAKLDDLRDWAKDKYDELLIEIVEDLRPNWTWKHDKWGAKTWYDNRSQMVFSGDGNGDFAWFETAELLTDRVEEHEEPKEINEDGHLAER